MKLTTEQRATFARARLEAIVVLIVMKQLIQARSHVEVPAIGLYPKVDTRLRFLTSSARRFRDDLEQILKEPKEEAI